jgi:hypothetical protein
MQNPTTKTSTTVVSQKCADWGSNRSYRTRPSDNNHRVGKTSASSSLPGAVYHAALPHKQPRNNPKTSEWTISHNTGRRGTPHQFFPQKTLLATLEQKNPLTSLHVYSPDDSVFCTPEKVMIDSGARVFVLISPCIAQSLNLTIDKGTSPLRGIGGAGGSLGKARETITLRLGACADGDKDVDPYKGCFTLKVRPIVMTPEAVASIGHNVLLGQGFIRYSLGMIDPLTERYHYSPAWWPHACKDFRVSVPCVCSAAMDDESPNFLGCIYADDEGDIDLSVCAPAIRRALKTGEIDPDDFPAAPTVAAPIPQAPGFPHGRMASQGNNTDNTDKTARIGTMSPCQLSRDVLANAQAQAANDMAHIVEPSGITYDVRKLKHSGRLMDNMRLDLSGAASSFIQQLKRVQQAIIDKVMHLIDERLSNGQSQSTRRPTSSAPAHTTPAPAAAPTGNSPEQPAAASPADITRRVSVMQPVLDARQDLPYTVTSTLGYPW